MPAGDLVALDCTDLCISHTAMALGNLHLVTNNMPVEQRIATMGMTEQYTTMHCIPAVYA